jgi:2-polyprenyl-3-methyl-5-hydroxy-6-metoxy-1,4-benzoquinol methylase
MNIRSILRENLNQDGLLYAFLRAAANPHNAMRRWQRAHTKSSIFQSDDELGGCSLQPIPLLEACLELHAPKSVLDVGCGTGKSLDWLLSKGIEVQGVEGSAAAIRHAENPDKILSYDLNIPLDLGRRFDLVWCFEVAEHIHPDFTDAFLTTLTNHSDHIVMSAAHPGQGGVGHFNEQPRAYWIEKLAQIGFVHDEDARNRLIRDWTWFPENLFVFRRIEPI